MLRRYISLLLLWNFIITSLSGVVLFIAPRGRYAKWAGWTFWGLTKDNWEAVYVIFAYLMIVLVIVHLYLNWNALKNYVKDKVKNILTKEFWITLIATILLFIGIVKEASFVKKVMDYSDKAKDYWERQSKVEMPVFHGEELTLKQFCSQAKIDYEKALNNLRKANIKFNEGEKLGDIAKKNNLSAYDIYKIMKFGGIQINMKNTEKQIHKNSFNNEGAVRIRVGKMTLKDFANYYKLDLNQLKQKLMNMGLKNVDENMTMRDIADMLNIHPSQLRSKLAGE